MSDREQDPYVLYLIVNTDINMSIGKTAAQCGHAVGYIYEYLKSSSSEERQKIFKNWKSKSSGTKIVLGASQKEFDFIKDNFQCFCVIDAGYTELEPGTSTVLSFFPMRKSERPKELKKLKVL